MFEYYGALMINWMCGGCGNEIRTHGLQYEVIRKRKNPNGWKKFYCCSANCLVLLGDKERVSNG